jgi:glycosyltransferase involved in cell wall biosynthesis
VTPLHEIGSWHRGRWLVSNSFEWSYMLTVVLPNYNHGQFLPNALQALLAQTRPADEVIIIDDASTDNSINIIEPLLPRFRDAKLVRHKDNVGVVRCMNIGLQMARGSLLAFCAADDVVYPTFFARMLALLDGYPLAAFASARTAIIDERGNRSGALEHSIPLDRPGYIDSGSAARHLMRDDAWFTGGATVFRRAPLIELGGFPEELGPLTDGYISRLLAVKHGSCFTPEVLVAWRRMEGGQAWSCSNDIASTERLAKRAERAMRESGAPFVEGYPKRWKRRLMFGVQRFALTNARRKARSEGAWQLVAALAREVLKTGWLLITLRPQDMPAILARGVRGLRK